MRVLLIVLLLATPVQAGLIFCECEPEPECCCPVIELACEEITPPSEHEWLGNSPSRLPPTGHPTSFLDIGDGPWFEFTKRDPAGFVGIFGSSGILTNDNSPPGFDPSPSPGPGTEASAPEPSSLLLLIGAIPFVWRYRRAF